MVSYRSGKMIALRTARSESYKGNYQSGGSDEARTQPFHIAGTTSTWHGSFRGLQTRLQRNMDLRVHGSRLQA